MKKIINGMEFTRIAWLGVTCGRWFEGWYPTENLPWLADRACFLVVNH